MRSGQLVIPNKHHACLRVKSGGGIGYAFRLYFCLFAVNGMSLRKG